MFRCLFCFCLCFLQVIDASQRVIQTTRQNYSQRFYNAFLIQSIGETRMAYHVFKGAFQDAQKAGESPSKLDVMNQLFIWYRKYGWSYGVMAHPSNCTDEFRRLEWEEDDDEEEDEFYLVSTKETQCSSQNYQSEWGKTPQQAKYIRNFMFGVAEITAAIFAVQIATPMGYVIATTAGFDGIGRIFDSLNEAWADYEEGRLRLKSIEKGGVA